MIAGMIATLGNQVALSAAVATMGSTEAYVTLQGFDPATETFDYLKCHTYSALMANKTKGQEGVDPDFLTYQQAMRGPDSDEWFDSMKKEIDTLRDMGTWEIVPRSMARNAGAKVIPSTWAF